MAKIIFSLFILLHGLIHLSGFFKAFGIGKISQLTGHISKPAGVIWLLIGMLFLITALLYFVNHSSWALFAIIAVVVSQVLIFTVWSDAKFGTIANIVVLLGALPAFGNFQFINMVKNEQIELLENSTRPSDRIIYSEDFKHLPTIVERWLHASGVPDKPDVTFVRLKQTGEIKTDPDGNWMDFTAVQYFDVKNPAFVWSVEVQMLPLIFLTGRDKLKDGEGEMLIKLLSLVNVVNDGHNEKINAGTLLRFLGEICWFPAAALNDYVTWEEVDALSARATLSLKGQQVLGIFRFRENGEMKSFEADRYFGGGSDATMEKWVVEAVEHKTFDGYRVPNKITVTWKLPEGDFTWLKLEIADLEVSRFELYP